MKKQLILSEVHIDKFKLFSLFKKILREIIEWFWSWDKIRSLNKKLKEFMEF